MAESDKAKLTDPFSVALDLEEGALARASARLVRRASDMRGYYADRDALEELIRRRGDPVHYEVFDTPVPEAAGHVKFGISKLQPGTVGDECFMTKGHYHEAAGTAEVYLCLRGRGCMLMKTAGGRCEVEEMRRGAIVYVPPHWAHRSVNTGDEPLISFCVYPAEAGHNYGDIAEEGFPKRIFRRNGEVVVE